MQINQKINIYPSNTSEWLSLIIDAQTKQSIYLCEDLESYVVFLLMRFSNKPDFLSKIICTDLLDKSSIGAKTLENKLQDIGDTCLIFTGFYPGIAHRRNVSDNYYIDIGKTAYDTLSINQKDSNGQVYKLLCQQFVPITNILKGMQNISGDK